ncbi:MAG: hypothetical protein L3J20_06525 [Flavobacteriaceae bacterium]|nr:hypothetical protein [Flavobacteriaceae bacterium]
MKNNTKKSFYDISFTLGQLNINNITQKEADKALIGIDFNNIRDGDVLILSIKVCEGETKAVKYLLDNGANPNLESSSYHYYKGPAILFALRNNRSKTGIKLGILKMLIDSGSNINETVQWYDEEQEKKVTGNYIEYGLELGLSSLQVMNGNTFGAESRKDARSDIKGLQAMLSMLQQSGININSETTKKLEEFLNIKTENNKKIDPKKLLKKALTKLKVTNYYLPSAAKEICYAYLENENFIPSKEWAELIKHLIIKISLTFEEVSKEVYEGKAVPFLDDEGWLSQGWDEYTWFGELIEILSNENTLKNAEWSNLLILIIKEHEKYDVDIEEAIEELLEEPWVTSHQSYQKIKEEIAKIY